MGAGELDSFDSRVKVAGRAVVDTVMILHVP
jgi:hypothetical protein